MEFPHLSVRTKEFEFLDLLKFIMVLRPYFYNHGSKLSSLLQQLFKSLQDYYFRVKDYNYIGSDLKERRWICK